MAICALYDAREDWREQTTATVGRPAFAWRARTLPPFLLGGIRFLGALVRILRLGAAATGNQNCR
jgi:hypothetical protein